MPLTSFELYVGQQMLLYPSYLRFPGVAHLHILRSADCSFITLQSYNDFCQYLTQEIFKLAKLYRVLSVGITNNLRPSVLCKKHDPQARRPKRDLVICSPYLKRTISHTTPRWTSFSLKFFFSFHLQFHWSFLKSLQVHNVTQTYKHNLGSRDTTYKQRDELLPTELTTAPSNKT